MEPYGDTVFCDDVRQEVGNKLTYVGVYQGIMYVTVGFPLVLPKLSLVMKYTELTQACPEKAEIIVQLPGANDDAAPAARTEIIFRENGKFVDGAGLRPDGKPSMRVTAINVLNFSPLVLPCEGWIDVNVRVVGREDLLIGWLYVKKAAESL